jgi:hypothetical protein
LQVTLWEEIKKTLKEDQYIQSMGRVATEEHEGSYTWRQRLLLYKGRVVISNDAPLKSKLLHEMHDIEVGGHSGVLRTFIKLVQ